MYKLFGSKPKEQIFIYLAKNPNKTLKEITLETKIAYKYVYKIILEFEENQIIEKNNKKYSLKSEFIEYYRKIADYVTENYIDNIYLKNQLDLYNAFCSLEHDEKIKNEVNGIIDSWFYKKLDDWYSKYYDPEKIELTKIIDAIKEKFVTENNLEILEVGAGTGRTTFQLIKKYPNITAIDISDKFINYCKKKSKKLKTKINFEIADISNFKSEKKYDLIIFNWMGFHYQKDINKINTNLKKLLKKNSLILILDAYYDTEYIEILQLLRENDLKHTKIRKEELNEKLIKEFGNFKQEVILTKYKFDSVRDVIDNFKIELTLEESHIWTKKDEEKLRKYLEKKKEPLIIGEGLWFGSISNN